MRALRLGAFLIVSSLLIASGCAQQNDTSPPADKEAKIKASLDKLDADDRKLAEEQAYCAVEPENRLGSMGTPIKIMIEDQPVFVCCKGCERRAKANPEKTLAKVKRLKDHHESHQEHE